MLFGWNALPWWRRRSRGMMQPGTRLAVASACAVATNKKRGETRSPVCIDVQDSGKRRPISRWRATAVRVDGHSATMQAEHHAAVPCAVQTKRESPAARSPVYRIPLPAYAKTARNTRIARWDHPGGPACHGDDGVRCSRYPHRTTCLPWPHPSAWRGRRPASARSTPWRPRPAMLRICAGWSVSTRHAFLMQTEQA